MAIRGWFGYGKMGYQPEKKLDTEPPKGGSGVGWEAMIQHFDDRTKHLQISVFSLQDKIDKLEKRIEELEKPKPRYKHWSVEGL